MNILLIGSGGREHALAWKIALSPKTNALYCLPGNPGMAKLGECVDISMTDITSICHFAVDKKIDLVVVGPEAPLVCGVVDALRAKNITAFGPTQMASTLEGSKAFMKDVVTKANVPTAFYARFDAVQPAVDYIHEKGAPIVIKADGLAAGKGVVVALDIATAEQAVRDMLEHKQFGDAGAQIIIEEFLDGEELSFFAICDGEHAIPFGSAQDHKRVGDGDTGPNTGGMGAYSPARMMTPARESQIMNEMILPTLREMNARGTPFTGVLFAGIMMCAGQPKLLEFNVRFGDPECQTLMQRLDTDLVDILYAAATGKLKELAQISWSSDPAICVVMAAKGYPAHPQTGGMITLPSQLDDGVKIFHAGTKMKDDVLVSSGGRVLNICATATDIKSARDKAYKTIEHIDFADGFCRKDIAYRALS
jgi:phosphoribosylamine---glycine ligase